MRRVLLVGADSIGITALASLWQKGINDVELTDLNESKERGIVFKPEPFLIKPMPPMPKIHYATTGESRNYITGKKLPKLKRI